MAHKKDIQREYAKLLYVQNGMTIEAIAKQVEVHNNTVRLWKAQDNWEQLKEIENFGTSEVVKNIKQWIFNHKEEINKRENASGYKGLPTAQEIKTIDDMTRVLDRYKDPNDIETRMKNAIHFTNFLKENGNEKIAVEVSKLIKPYIEYLSK